MCYRPYYLPYIWMYFCLDSCGFGCYISQSFVGALGYADDIVLLTPTRYRLSRLLRV